jgi:hypothetical protein
MRLAYKLPGELLLILLLFLHARIMMLVILPTDDLTLYGDYRYYYDLASLVEWGYYPFLDYWLEYPPIFPFLSLGLYWLTGGVFHNYVVLTGLILLLFEAGLLSVLYLLTAELYGQKQAGQVGWIYLALYLPLFIWLRQFDVMGAFIVLLALLALRWGRLELTGLLIGIGAMIKVFPLLLLATVWRTAGLRAALRSGAVAAIVIGFILGPLWWWSPEYTLASLLAQPSKSSWQTIWALLDGNIGNTGNFGFVEDHLDPDKATELLHRPSRLPTWLTLIPFGAVGLWLLFRPVKHQADVFIFTALTFILFFLWSKGWSPQWQILLLPLLFLSLPLQRALLFVLVLGTVNFIEWPIILSRGLVNLLPLTVIARTLLLLLLGWLLYERLERKA